MQKLIIFSLAILMGGCADRGYYRINGQSIRVQEAALVDIDKSWKNQPRTAFGNSAAPDIGWISELIAVSEARGIGVEPPCRSLTAMGLKSLPLARIALPRQSQSSLEYFPVNYHEQWIVNACGTQREWRIFDDPKASDPLTVILWRANY